ncbi:glycoside hydrolase family 97 protein, partial [Campylobacter jejuni]|nr:glycoside hydrolase family 97 protein [Campylobacter jejuni]
MKRKMMSLLLALAVISGSSVYAKVIDVMSPNGAIKVSVDIKDRIYYSVSYDNDQLLKDCYLNLQLQNETLGTNPHLRSTKRGTIDESVKREIPFKNAIVRNHCNTLRMNFSGNYAVEFRVFDNGIAYRFVTDKKGDNIVMGEDFAINF